MGTILHDFYLLRGVISGSLVSWGCCRCGFVGLCVYFSPLSSGWGVPPSRLASSPPFVHVGVLYVILFVEHVRAFYECDQFVYPFEGSCESSPLGVSSMSECMSVSVVHFAFQCDMLSGLDCSSTWAFNCLGWYEALIVFSSVCMSSSALDQPAERFPVC